MKKTGGIREWMQSDQIFSWVMFICFVIYVNITLFFVISKKPQVVEPSETVLKQRIAKLVMSADFEPVQPEKPDSGVSAPGEDFEEKEEEEVKEPEPEEVEVADAGQEGESEEPESKQEKEKEITHEQQVTQARNKVKNIGLLAELAGRGRSEGSGASASGLLGSARMEEDLDQVLKGLDGIKVASAGESDGSMLGRGLVEGGAGGSVDKLSSLFSEEVEKTEDVTLEREGELQLSGPGPIEGEGSKSSFRTSMQINEVVKSHLGSLKYCYNRELKRNPSLQGRIVIMFKIQSDGNISECRVVESSMGNASVEKCLTRSIKRWRFPEILEGETEVTYPFVFFPEN